MGRRWESERWMSPRRVLKRIAVVAGALLVVGVVAMVAAVVEVVMAVGVGAANSGFVKSR